MTKKLTFTGHSDDLFCVSINDKPHDDANCFDKKATYKLESKSGEMLVVAEYVKNGVWLIGVTQVDDEIEIPEWKITIKRGHGYSPALLIECPNDVKIKKTNIFK